ncbi:hypothetical protein EJV47_00535 [Hymenobacter gummosus]|uniref:Dienelactone hydrolase domain-containing protein n=1 Tax=Hymenobacter gummosus TaxID=1776032 RepID=A0A431U7T9_9BACT|nr:hypothetical protein [Hymenobacter gummosus]RTQ53261.1 hypothetical protein EJV47_00535 [Hymenobacter gummosus]
MRKAVDWTGTLLRLAVGLAGCTPAATEQPPAAPTGRYEGTLTYRGAELPVVLNLTQDTVSRSVQLLLRTPAAPPYSRWFDSVAYQAPALTARLPGGSRLALREEPNFLTGTVWLNDTLRAELVAVRRGTPDLPSYAVIRASGQPAARSFVPLDTVQRRPALLLWAAPGGFGAACGWADWLARQGMVVTVAAPGAQPDSVAARQLSAALQLLRNYGAAGVDSGRVGVWAAGSGGRAALLAVAAGARPAGLIVQGAALAGPDQAWLRSRGRRGLRRPVLGLYGGRDTALNVPESSQLLRKAVAGQPQSGVKVYALANGALLLPAPADSVRRWPLPPADLAPSLWEWLSGLRSGR